LDLTVIQVRVVQHKQTRELYALKYINKSKCVKMKAVPNIIQERRLLEEVRNSGKSLVLANF
jgi:serine/threonine kinase 32